jgi:hypothetical protein
MKPENTARYKEDADRIVLGALSGLCGFFFVTMA